MDRDNAIEEIALIRRVIDDSRKFTMDNGRYLILWGVIIAAAIFIEYWMLVTGNAASCLWLWIITIGIGWIVSMIWGFRQASKHRTWPIGARLVGMVWSSCGIAMTIFGFVGAGTGAIHGWAVSPTLAVVMGMGYAISGLVYRLRWVSFVGVAWWVGSLAMFYVKGIETLLIFGIMMVIFQVVPGLVFYTTSKKKTAGAISE